MKYNDRKEYYKPLSTPTITDKKKIEALEKRVKTLEKHHQEVIENLRTFNANLMDNNVFPFPTINEDGTDKAGKKPKSYKRDHPHLQHGLS